MLNTDGLVCAHCGADDLLGVNVTPTVTGSYIHICDDCLPSPGTPVFGPKMGDPMTTTTAPAKTMKTIVSLTDKDLVCDYCGAGHLSKVTDCPTVLGTAWAYLCDDCLPTVANHAALFMGSTIVPKGGDLK